MGLAAEYAISCRHLPFVDVASEVPAAALDVEIVATAEDTTPFVVEVTADDPDAVERAFESAAFVGDYSLAGRTGETRRYKVRPAVTMEEQLGDHVDDLSALRDLADTRSVIERISVTPTGWVQRGWFADREVLETFRTFWRRNGEFRLRHLARDGDRTAIADELTAAQREAVRTAYEMGHFEIPRRASLDDVAAELGISASSLSERLRRAQTHLVETTVASRTQSMTE